MQYSIPIKLPSLANLRVHWRKMARLKKQQRLAVWMCMREAKFPPGPLRVTITRIGPRKLDDDNLASACKYVRDQIANMVGVDDGDSYYEWCYRQRIGRYTVEIDIEERSRGAVLHLD